MSGGAGSSTMGSSPSVAGGLGAGCRLFGWGAGSLSTRAGLDEDEGAYRMEGLLVWYSMDVTTEFRAEIVFENEDVWDTSLTLNGICTNAAWLNMTGDRSVC